MVHNALGNALYEALSTHKAIVQDSSIFQLSSLIIESFLIHIGQLKAFAREEMPLQWHCSALERQQWQCKRRDLHKNVSNFILHCMLNQFSSDVAFLV